MYYSNEAFCDDSTAVVDEIPELKKQKVDKSDKALEATIKQQSIAFFDHRDYVERALRRSNWIQLLEVNAQKIPQDNQEVCVCIASYNFKHIIPSLNVPRCMSVCMNVSGSSLNLFCIFYT